MKIEDFINTAYTTSIEECLQNTHVSIFYNIYTILNKYKKISVIPTADINKLILDCSIQDFYAIEDKIKILAYYKNIQVKKCTKNSIILYIL